MIHRDHSWLWLLLLCVTIGFIQPATATDLDEDDLFGSFNFVSELDEVPAESFLVRESAEFGGSFNFSLGSSWQWSSPDGIGKAPDRESLTSNLQTTVFADLRPEEDYRVFGKATISYPFVESEAKGPLKPGRRFDEIVKITELFADFDHEDKLFFRVGKQTIGWGAGYFFSPADIINLTPIDPEDPEADREGPLSVKINRPIDKHNLYLYLLADRAERLDELAVAPKAEIVLGGTEVGVGAYVKKERAPMAMVTISSGVGKAAVFGEAVLKHGSDKRYVRKVDPSPDNPMGIDIYTRDNEYFASATGGMRYSRTDDKGLYNLTMAAQYFYNGEGYQDPDTLLEVAPPLVVGKQLSVSDVLWPSKHYGAVSVLWSDALKTGVSANLLCLASLTEANGYATASLSWKPLERVSTSIGLSYAFGEAGGEYTYAGNPVSLSVRVSMGSGRF